jgi:hypothetical protein
MTAKLPSFLQGFRLVTGDALNAIIDAVNNLTGNGTANPVVGTTGTFSGVVTSAGNTDTLVALTTNGAINPNLAANYVITKAGVLADTLAAPTATTDDGKVILITSNTANAHTLTATGLLQTGSASVNVATFAANAGAGLTLMAYQGKWNVLGSVGITFS